jgi:phenylalanyl-tRNA synthetase alpha chain
MFRQLYKKDVQVRLRPGYFPFTEPSYETDLSCTFCDQKGCRVCKYTGWIEMGGSGMIHPNVLKAAGYPEGKYTGFAWGMGPNRLAMLKYGIPDIRYFMENDIRFLHQF